jgi:uncharacterized protein YegJ (DUF2314 family)
MSEAQPSRVFMFDNTDPEMQRAYEQARATFKYFWREMAWERRRIIPALDLAAVKAPFSDDGPGQPKRAGSKVEHMWFAEIDFDGVDVHGVLLNSPNEVRAVKKGDEVRVPLGEISDWMYSVGGEVYGAFTVNLMRSRMKRRERDEHDAAWGRNFGDPRQARLVPGDKKSGEVGEHPMSEAMATRFQEQVGQDPSLLQSRDDRGWTFLHQEALAGNLATVQVMLDAGADVNAKTDGGATPLQLARSLGWDRVVALLVSKGAK